MAETKGRKNGQKFVVPTDHRTFVATVPVVSNNFAPAVKKAGVAPPKQQQSGSSSSSQQPSSIVPDLAVQKPVVASQQAPPVKFVPPPVPEKEAAPPPRPATPQPAAVREEAEDGSQGAPDAEEVEETSSHTSEHTSERAEEGEQEEEEVSNRPKGHVVDAFGEYNTRQKVGEAVLFAPKKFVDEDGIFDFDIISGMYGTALGKGDYTLKGYASRVKEVADELLKSFVFEPAKDCGEGARYVPVEAAPLDRLPDDDEFLSQF